MTVYDRRMPRSIPLRVVIAAAVTIALAGCKSKEEKESERLMPAVDALCARIPKAEPREVVRTTFGYADAVGTLEETSRALTRPPAGTPAAARLAPALQWIESARTEITTLETAFQAELGGVEQEAHTELTKAVLGGDTKSAGEMAAALARYRERPLLLWHGTGDKRGFDEDHQHLPPERRAVDPGAKFVVAYVQRMNGEGVTYVNEKVTSERKVAFVALYDVTSRRRLGIFTVRGETAKLPSPVPLAGTVIPGERPPLLESLLRAP